MSFGRNQSAEDKKVTINEIEKRLISKDFFFWKTARNAKKQGIKPIEMALSI